MRGKLRRFLATRMMGYPRWTPGWAPDYADDGMLLWGKSVEFTKDPRFRKAYEAAIARAPRSLKHKLHHRIATICWAANHGAKLAGDFVECGVNTGIYAMAACHYVDFHKLNKRFYLFDTFAGIPPSQAEAEESSKPKHYIDVYEDTRQAFSSFANVSLVRGTVPETLDTVAIERVAFLSIDMNIAYPERKAVEHFWPKLSSGAIVVFDDYAFSKHNKQKEALDDFAQANGFTILSLPTGHGLAIKAGD